MVDAEDPFFGVTYMLIANKDRTFWGFYMRSRDFPTRVWVRHDRGRFSLSRMEEILLNQDLIVQGRTPLDFREPL